MCDKYIKVSWYEKNYGLYPVELDIEYCPCGGDLFKDLDVCALCCQGVNCSQCGDELDYDCFTCSTCTFNPRKIVVNTNAIKTMGIFDVEVPDWMYDWRTRVRADAFQEYRLTQA